MFVSHVEYQSFENEKEPLSGKIENVSGMV
jgi:hypothetical protein